LFCLYRRTGFDATLLDVGEGVGAAEGLSGVVGVGEGVGGSLLDVGEGVGAAEGLAGAVVVGEGVGGLGL